MQSSNTKEAILSKLDKVILKVVKQISEGEPPAFTHLNRVRWDNVSYDPEVGLHSSGIRKQTTVKFDSKKSVKKFGLMMKVISVMYRLIQTDTYSTKRDLFYQDTAAFGSQNILDEIVDTISCMVEIPRWQLNILATSKGCVAGSLSYKDGDGFFIDCSKTKCGVLVPAHVNAIEQIRTDAKFVLVVEKDAVFQKLLDNDILRKFQPCIIVTGKGFPDINTRMLLHRLWRETNTPMMALVDADPYGIEIMSVYKFGSKSLSYKAEHLTVPSIQWLGLLPSDIHKLKLNPSGLLDLTKSDIDKISGLMSRPYSTRMDQLSIELQIMKETGKKAEIEILDSISDSFLTDVYIQAKLKILLGDIGNNSPN